MIIQGIEPTQAQAAVKELIERFNNGRFIQFDQKNSLVLWQSLHNHEYIVHKVCAGPEKFVLENGNYFHSDNADDAMLKFLARKGKRVSIEVYFSEDDIQTLSDGLSLDWEYKSNSDIMVDMSIMPASEEA